MNEASRPTTVTVRALLAHFHSTLDQAHRTGEPVIIALRHRQPAGVLLGYETWQALANGQPSAQTGASALQAELAAERQRGANLAAELAAARRQVEEVSRDLAAARQRVAELEARRVRPQPADPSGAGWGVAPQPEPPAMSPDTWAGPSWGAADAQKPPVKARWGQQ